jgi:hypothetical protein
MEKQLYADAEYSEPKTSSDSEDAQLIGGRSKLTPPRQGLLAIWQIVGFFLFILVYTPLVAFMTRRTAIDDPTHGGKIIKCECSRRIFHRSL